MAFLSGEGGDLRILLRKPPSSPRGQPRLGPLVARQSKGTVSLTLAPSRVQIPPDFAGCQSTVCCAKQSGGGDLNPRDRLPGPTVFEGSARAPMGAIGCASIQLCPAAIPPSCWRVLPLRRCPESSSPECHQAAFAATGQNHGAGWRHGRMSREKCRTDSVGTPERQNLSPVDVETASPDSSNSIAIRLTAVFRVSPSGLTACGFRSRRCRAPKSRLPLHTRSRQARRPPRRASTTIAAKRRILDIQPYPPSKADNSQSPLVPSARLTWNT